MAKEDKKIETEKRNMSSERERSHCREHQKFPTHGTTSADQTEAAVPRRDPDLSETLELS